MPRLNRYCPFCGQQSLYFIEVCESEPKDEKTSWSCACTNMVVYIYHFNVNRKKGGKKDGR